MIESLFSRIDSKREELVSFTQELVRIPTINPPGEDYLKCAEPVSYTHLTLPTIYSV